MPSEDAAKRIAAAIAKYAAERDAPTRDALIAAVAANPADDLPRLVLADWLDENGEEDRAELVRLEVAARRAGSGHTVRSDKARSGGRAAAVSKRLREVVGVTSWHTPAELAELDARLRHLAAGLRGLTTGEYSGRVRAVADAVSPLFPGYAGLKRLADQYAALAPDEPHRVRGDDSDVRVHFDPGGKRWVAGSGLVTLPRTTASTAVESALYGMARRGEQAEFGGVSVHPLPEMR